ncbi:MAG: T9SS type A sorting domain-containing protein [Bacteroidota bacterium]
MKHLILIIGVSVFVHGSLIGQTSFDIASVNGTTLSNCNSSLFDSGGNTQPYGPNEDYSVTFCPTNSSERIVIDLTFTDLGAGDQLCILDGDSDTAPLLDCVLPSISIGNSLPSVMATSGNATGCLTLTFISDATEQGDGFELQISCTLACQEIDLQLVSTSPPFLDPIEGFLDICPGEEVQFNVDLQFPNNGTFYTQSIAQTTLNWDFGDDLNTMEGSLNESHLYDRPGGYRANLIAEDQNGCTDTLAFGNGVRVSPGAEINISSNAPIFVGDTLQLVGKAIPNTAYFVPPFTFTDDLFIPDGFGPPVEYAFSFDEFEPGDTLTDANDLFSVCVNMEHSWMHDIEVELECPSGQVVLLQNQTFLPEIFLGIPNENDGSPFNNPMSNPPGLGFDYCWTNAAAQTWTEWDVANPGVNSLPSGAYASFEPLSNLEGCPLDGEWALRVEDKWGIDNGWVFSLSLEFNPELFPDLDSIVPVIVTEAWESTPDAIGLINDSLNVLATSADQYFYTFRAEDNFDCELEKTIAIEVLPNPNSNEICINTTGLIIDDFNTVFGGAPVSSSQGCPVQELNSLEVQPGQTYAINSIQAGQDYVFSACNGPNGNCMGGQNWNLQFTIIAPSGAIDGFGLDASSDCSISWTASESGPYQVIVNEEGFCGNSPNIGIGNGYPSITCDQFGNLPCLQDCIPGFSAVVTPPNPCQGIETSDISISVSGGNAPYTFNWSNGATTSSVSNLSNGLYTVAVSDTDNCPYHYTFFINEAPIINLTGTVDIVQNGCTGPFDISIAPIGGLPPYTYQWSNGMTNASLSNLPEGSYACTVIDQNGCSSVQSSIDAFYPPPLILSKIGTFENDIECNGEQNGGIFTNPDGGTPPYTYQWSNGSTTKNILNLGPGSYTLTLTDAQGCTLIAPGFEVLDPPPILLDGVATIIQPVLCFGEESGAIDLTIQGGIPPYEYEWSNGEVTEDISNLESEIYWCEVVDDNGCIFNTPNFFVPQAPLLEVDPSDILTTNPTCPGESSGSLSVNASGGTPPYSFQWSTGATTNGLSNIPAGNYLATVTDANGCTLAGLAVNLNDPTPISLSAISLEEPLCNGEASGLIDINPVAGTPPYSFLWSNGVTDEDLIGVGAGDYVGSITDANGCIFVSSMLTLTEPDPLSSSAMIVGETSIGSTDGSIDLMPAGGTPDYTFLWSTGASTEDIAELPAGDYSVTITDANGCEIVEMYGLMTNVDDIETLEVFTLTPNPSTGQVLFTLGFIQSESIQLEIINVLGQVLHREELRAVNFLQKEMNLEHFPGGIYYVRILSNGRTATRELILSR